MNSDSRYPGKRAFVRLFFRCSSVRDRAKNNVQQYQHVKNNVIQIGYEAFFTHGNEPYRVFEAFIVSFQFAFGSAEDGVIPMTKKLNNKPYYKDRKQDPSACGLKQVISDQTYAV